MKGLVIVACMLMVGCAKPPRPHSYNETAGLGIVYGAAMTTYIVGHRDDQPEEIEIACKHLRFADGIAKDIPEWPTEYVEKFDGLAEFRAACAKKVTEN